MAIGLDHLIVPSHDPLEGAKSLAGLLGVPWAVSQGPFSPVYVNETLTVDFADRATVLPYTLTPTDLLLSKLQIVELNEKDLQDILYLLAAFPIRDGDEPGTVGTGRIAAVIGQDWGFVARERRPPPDPVNAMLSFGYTLLTHEAVAALAAASLDPAVGFLHADRPGRLSLALDLVEEFRPLLADRLALALINLRQVRGDGFMTQPGGAVLMDDKTRRAVLTGLTQRKREEVLHPLLDEKITIGLLPHVQARLLARVLRGDLEDYPALVLK